VRAVDQKVDAVDQKVDAVDRKVDRVHEDLTQRLKSLQQAMIGESVLGRYTVAEVEERLDAIEKRLSILEQR
jgi:tetrahydromethanopterin S-methyltransferase subunit G